MLAVHRVDGFHSLPHGCLLPAKAHEVQADRAIVERVGRGATHHFAALGLALIAGNAVAQLDVGEVGGGDLRRESGRVGLGAPEGVFLILR